MKTPMPILLSAQQVAAAVEAMHGSQLRELLDYAEPYEGTLQYCDAVTSWLIAHGKALPAGDRS